MLVGEKTLKRIWKEFVEENDDGVLNFGNFMSKSSDDHPTLVLWASKLSLALECCSNGVVSWDELRASLLTFLSGNPKCSPHLGQAHIDTLASSEMCATAFKRMMTKLRRAAMYTPRKLALINKCGAQSRQLLTALIDKIHVEECEQPAEKTDTTSLASTTWYPDTDVMEIQD